MKTAILFLMFIIIPLSNNAQNSIKLASFNIQIFGVTKSAKPEIMDTIVSVISNYDIIAIQEVKDKTGVTVPRLLTALNASGNGKYKFFLSERTGKQSDDVFSQEQYLILYDSTKIVAYDSVTIDYSFINTHSSLKMISSVYNDKQDHFQREPSIAFFSTVDSSFKFTVLNIHTKPQEAFEEVDALLRIGNEMNSFYKYILTSNGFEPSGNQNFLKNIIMLGDYNADCSYLSESEIISLKEKYSLLYWLIPEDVKTNLATSLNCTYDRIVITKDMIGHITGNYGVDRSFSSSEVSDHYPIWYEFTY